MHPGPVGFQEFTKKGATAAHTEDFRIQAPMETPIEEKDASMFAHVVYLAAAAILVIIIAAIIIVSWRAHKKNTPPFTKHPVSQLQIPERTSSISLA